MPRISQKGLDATNSYYDPVTNRRFPLPKPVKLSECPQNPKPYRPRGGRPSKMHPSGASSFSYIIQLAGIGMKDAEIREKLNVSERNWYRWLARTDDDGVENRVRLLRATVAAVSKTHQAMFDAAINGKVGAARELLARLGAYGRKRA